METTINDYQHQITSIIKYHSDEEGFPKSEDYGFTIPQLDDYLFEKQAILDSEGETKTQYTIYGVLIVAPVIVFSAFPDESLPGGSNAIFIALALGLILAFLYKLLRKTIINVKLKKLYDTDKERYIDDIKSFDLRYRNKNV
jgi:hypothetical protein